MIFLNVCSLIGDKTKIYKGITSQEDQVPLQLDLRAMQDWSDKWNLNFHPEKCKKMTVHGRRNIDFGLLASTLRDQVVNIFRLHILNVKKDLGVTMDERHIQEKVNTANKIMGIIRRVFRFLDALTFKWLFKSIVRPYLEFAQSVWSPWRQINIISIENMHERATRLLSGMSNLSYSDRLRTLEIPTLAYRHLREDMIEIFKRMMGK